MYHTPLGIRVLQGAERQLFIESLAMIVDDLSIDDGPFEIAVFERLQRNQKIAVLHTMARGLLCGREPAQKLTAAIEAAVATVFLRELAMLEFERDLDESEAGEPHLSWRELILAAGREAEIDDLPSVTEDDPDQWELLLDCLEGQILWDHDWEMEQPLDADPDDSQKLKQEMGINDNYFIAVPPDPSDEEAERLLVELRELTADAR